MCRHTGGPAVTTVLPSFLFTRQQQPGTRVTRVSASRAASELLEDGAVRVCWVTLRISPTQNDTAVGSVVSSLLISYTIR